MSENSKINKSKEYNINLKQLNDTNKDLIQSNNKLNESILKLTNILTFMIIIKLLLTLIIIYILWLCPHNSNLH